MSCKVKSLPAGDGMIALGMRRAPPPGTVAGEPVQTSGGSHDDPLADDPSRVHGRGGRGEHAVLARRPGAARAERHRDRPLVVARRLGRRGLGQDDRRLQRGPPGQGRPDQDGAGPGGAVRHQGAGGLGHRQGARFRLGHGRPARQDGQGRRHRPARRPDPGRPASISPTSARSRSNPRATRNTTTRSSWSRWT